MIESLKIVGLCNLAAICYGIVHDSVTSRICVEYFTIFHQQFIFLGDSPNRLALYWGIVATWWMGAGLGLPLAIFARWGRPPKVAARDLARPLGRLLLVMGVFSLLAGIAGYILATWRLITLREPWVSRIDVDRHPLFLADLWAHSTAYGVGFVGGVILWGWCVRFRQQPV